MKNIRFNFKNQPVLVERHPTFAGGAFIHFGGSGFHYVALVEGNVFIAGACHYNLHDLKRAVDVALSEA